MCMPQNAFGSTDGKKIKERKKRHVEFDENRYKPDKDFVDERTKPHEEKKKKKSFLDRLLGE